MSKGIYKIRLCWLRLSVVRLKLVKIMDPSIARVYTKPFLGLVYTGIDNGWLGLIFTTS